MLFRNITLSIFTIIALFGCSSVQVSQTQVEWQAHQQKLQQITDFQISGKLAYISPEQRQSLNFQWNKQPHTSQLRLTNFLGQTVLNMKVNENGAEVITYEDDVYRASTASELVRKLTRLNIPVEALQHWLLGQATETDSYTLTDKHTLATLRENLTDDSWNVNFISYQDIPDGNTVIPLPEKLTLKQGETSLKLIIANWAISHD
jgi:outer membrane lipoprotein LolB